MKRKPMLYHKLMEKGRVGAREVIGLIGTHHGVGVTHTALMLAFHMGENLGKKTALLECNKHHDMNLIREAYEWSKAETLSFTFRQITCFQEVTTERIPVILGEDYECLILDFGDDLTTNRDEFLRCTTKIVVGGRSEWDLAKLIQFAKISESLRGSDTWLYYIPQTEDNKAIKISNLINRRVWAVPRMEDPTRPSHISYRFFRQFFH